MIVNTTHTIITNVNIITPYGLISNIINNANVTMKVTKKANITPPKLII